MCKIRYKVTKGMILFSINREDNYVSHYNLSRYIILIASNLHDLNKYNPYYGVGYINI